MKDTLVDFYGLKFFEQEWDRWMQVFIRIYTQHGGDFCASRLDRIQCPTLIIHGEEDGLIPPDHGEFLHKNIRDSRQVIHYSMSKYEHSILAYVSQPDLGRNNCKLKKEQN